MRSFLNIRVLYYEFIAKTTNGFDGGCGADFGKFFAKIGHINFDIIVFGYHFGAPDMCKNIVFLNTFFFGADEHVEDFGFLFGEWLGIEGAFVDIEGEVGERNGARVAKSWPTGEGVDAGYEFFGFERFGKVIVGTNF